MNKPWYKRWQTYAIGIVALGLLGAVLPEPPAETSEVKSEVQTVDTEEKAETVIEKPAEPPAPLTLEDEIRAYLGERKIHDIGVVDGYYTINADFGDFVSRDVAEEESIELAELAYEHADYDAGATRF